MKIHSSQQISGLRHQKRFNNQPLKKVFHHDIKRKKFYSAHAVSDVQHPDAYKEYLSTREEILKPLFAALELFKEGNEEISRARIAELLNIVNTACASYVFSPEEEGNYSNTTIQNTIEDLKSCLSLLEAMLLRMENYLYINKETISSLVSRFTNELENWQEKLKEAK